MTEVAANVTASPPVVGSTIYATFSWSDCKLDTSKLARAIMYIKDPNGTTKKLHLEPVNATGNKSLSTTADKPGTWTATIEGCVTPPYFWIKRTASVKIEEAAPPPPPPPPPPEEDFPIVSFYADPTTIKPGETSTLHWTVKNATNQWIDGNYIAASGSRTVFLTKTTSFLLTAWNDKYTTQKLVTIIVLPFVPPPPPPPPPPPEVICTPGEKKCEGNDLYECSEDGTKWELKERNSKICVQPEACPDFWRDPVGAVICWILSGIEALLGWTQGTFLTTLANMWDLITNFFGDIYDFFSDIVGSIVDVVVENAGALFSWISDQFLGFIDWLAEIGGDIADFVGDKVAGAIDWVKENAGELFDWISDQFLGFIDWLGEIGGDIAGFVGDAVGGAIEFLSDSIGGLIDWLAEIGGSVADYIGDAISGFVDWTAAQLGSIWEGIVEWFTEAISGFVEAFFGGVNTGIEQARGSPLHSDEELKNPILKGLRKVVREHRKKHNRDEITGEKKHGPI